jgi:peptidoglycan/LPS O-acetylase OafA/YrhL
MTHEPSPPGKFLALEAVRGVAATVVLLHHFLLLVAPRLHGRNFPDDPIALVRTPLYALVNGSAAVAVFFVLSGFVLTFRAMEARDWRPILSGLIRRWPRLVPLVVTVNVISALFFMLGFYADDTWFNLARYQGAGTLERGASVIAGAVAEGAYSTFIRGTTDFNPALWTMHYELVGSFAAYATALILMTQKSFGGAMALGGAALLATATLAGKGGVYYAMPVAGALIARATVEREALAPLAAAVRPWRPAIALGVAALAVVLLGYDGYSKPVGFYAFMAPVSSPRAEPLIHGVAAVAIVGLVVSCDPIRGRLIGQAAGLLGRLSFPVYLVHLPILHGLVAPVHAGLVARCDGTVADLTAFALFIVLTLSAATPLARLDKAWVRRLRASAGLRSR